MSIFYNLHVACSAIDRDDELDVFFRELIYEMLLQSIAIVDAVGETIGYLYTDGCKKPYKKGSRTHSIHIVVSEHHDTFFFVSCLENPIYSQIHAIHQERIVEMMKGRMKEFILLGLFELVESSVDEEFRHEWFIGLACDIEYVSTKRLHYLDFILIINTILFNPEECEPSVIHVVLENFEHLSLIFWWILVEIFCEWNEIRIALISYISSLDKLENMVVALELLFSSIDGGFHSFRIFLIRLVVHTRIREVGSRILFFECHLEAETIGLDKFEFIRPEGREELFEAFCEIVTRILVYGCSIEVYEQVLEPHFFHTIYGDIRIGIVEVFTEVRYETVVVVTGTVVIDKIGQKSSDPVYSCRIFLVFCRIEYRFIETTEDRSGFCLKADDIGRGESELRKVGSHDLTEYLLELAEVLCSAEIVVDEFLQCRILYFCHGGSEGILFGGYVEVCEYRKVVWMRRKYPFLLRERSVLEVIEPGALEVRPTMGDGRCEEIASGHAEEHYRSEKADDITGSFPFLFFVERHI